MAQSILIKHATILPMDQVGLVPTRVIEDGALVTREDKILALGKCEEVIKEHSRADIVIDGSGKIVIPGFVNVHSHVTGSFLRGLLEDIPNHFYHYALPLEDFLTEESTFKFSQIGAVEAVKYGITCVNDIYHYADATARAIDKVGMRGVVAHKVFDADLSKIKDDKYVRDPELGQKRLEANIKLVKDWHGKADGRITCRIGTHATDTCRAELLKAGREAATKLGVGIHIHVAQSTKETAYIRRTHKKSSVQYLDSLGFLDSDVVAAHLVYASKADLRVVKARGVNVAHCPSIYGKVCHFPRIEDMYSTGLSIALGTDWLTMDMWDTMKQAIGISRVLTGKMIMTADKALDMATITSARALGLSDNIGSLSPGKKADFIVVPSRKAHLRPLRNWAQNLVYYGNGGDVETVVVDGRFVVQNGRLETLDEQEVVREAQEAAEEVWSHVPYPKLVNANDMKSLNI